MRTTAPPLRTLLLCFLLVAFGMPLFPGPAKGEERIPFAFPPLARKKMPPVFFAHDKHVEYMERADAECTLCHRETEAGMSETFLDVREQPASEQIPYLHASCTQCHRKADAGPRLVDCRVCHNQAIAARNGKNK